jgi:DNA (cytosine-5)-methyltransferase 1
MRYIDLFAGAGGLSEGFIREGFTPIAHVEMNREACLTIKTRLAYHFLKENNQLEAYKNYLLGNITREQLYSYLPEDTINTVINAEISDQSIDTVFEKIDRINKNQVIDLIIGGPPCQAYSVIGRARAKNKMVGDKRNHLFLQYANFLEKYQPKVFVFENVTGLTSAGNGNYLKEMYDKFTSLDYHVNIHLDKNKNSEKVDIFNTANYGVLQNRQRVIIIGYKKNINFQFNLPNYQLLTHAYNIKDELLSDLPILQQNETKSIALYTKGATNYQEMACLRDKNFDFTTQHIARPHNKRDLEIYQIAIELWLNERKRLNYAHLREDLKTHKNQDVFQNRFQVVNPFGVCHTVVAHISCDGHYYIYPDLAQIRSISVREAARIQSFPDNYFFEGSRTAAFKQIGNAVPPMFAQQIAKAIKNAFNTELLNNEKSRVRIIQELALV